MIDSIVAMSYQENTTTVSPSTRNRGPDLEDSTRFVKVERVPIIDTLERAYFKRGKDGKQVKVKESVDEDQLWTLLENSRLRSEKGEHGLVFIGHTDDEGREIDQPPLVGYLNNHQMGEHNGNPTIYADVYLDKLECDPSRTLRQFPRRSAEVVALSNPKGYIDSVALLKRTPERDLGYVISQHRSARQVSRFMCPACEADQKKAVRGEQKLRTGDAHKKVVKGALGLVNTLIEELITSKVESSSSSSEPSAMSGGGSSDHDEFSMFDPSSESSAMSNKSRYAMSSSSSSEPSEEEPSIDSSSSEPSDVKAGDNSKGAKKTPKPSRRMDPSNTGPNEPSGEPSDEPSRMHKKGKKSKMSAGGGAGVASPYTSPPSMSAEASQDARPTVKTKTRMSRESDRMDQDSERISITRLMRTVETQAQKIESLMTRLNSKDEEARANKVERFAIQLEAEGYQINRKRVVTRFMKLSDEEIVEEMDDIRATVKQSPVNTPMLQGLGADLGGSTLQRPVNPADLFNPLPEECSNGGIPIIGSHLVRFAKEQKIHVKKRNGDDREDHYDNMSAANLAISRFMDNKTKTRNG